MRIPKDMGRPKGRTTKTSAEATEIIARVKENIRSRLEYLETTPRAVAIEFGRHSCWLSDLLLSGRNERLSIAVLADVARAIGVPFLDLLNPGFDASLYSPQRDIEGEF